MFHSPLRSLVRIALVLSAMTSACPGSLAADPYLVPRTPHKQLVLDTRVIQSTAGAKLTVGTVAKDPHNPLFRADRPWENALNNLYPNVHYDAPQRLFKLWYKCVLADKDVIAKMDQPSTIHDVGWYLLYATSRDGLHWDKPELGLHKFDGQANTNAVTRDTPNVGVFHDPHDPDAARRYKMIYDVGSGKLRVRFSDDGVHWTEPQEPRGFGSQNGDTHNNAFWDERLGKYVLITRIFVGERLVARSESADFLHWAPPQLVLRSAAAEGKATQTYCMPAFPYANIYLGYAMMYHPGTDRSVDCELTWSPDSVTWQRVQPGTPFLPRGPQGSHDAMCIYGPAGPAIAQDGQLLIFYGGSEVPHRGWKRHCLPCLARLRLDGFAGYESEQPGATATIVTQPMRATGEPLRVSADAQGGTVRVSILDAPRFGSEPSASLSADVTDEAVVWSGRDFATLKGQIVRLRFEITRAKVYAFSGLEIIPAH
jgi:hypothetical protein